MVDTGERERDREKEREREEEREREKREMLARCNVRCMDEISFCLSFPGGITNCLMYPHLETALLL